MAFKCKQAGISLGHGSLAWYALCYINLVFEMCSAMGHVLKIGQNEGGCYSSWKRGRWGEDFTCLERRRP